MSGRSSADSVQSCSVPARGHGNFGGSLNLTDLEPKSPKSKAPSNY